MGNATPEKNTLSESSSVGTHGMSGSALAKAIFRAEVPEEYIRSVPAQSLYLAIKQNGLTSSSEIIEIATLEQCRLLIDFDCWNRDTFDEEQFWEWLSLTDEEDGLVILQRIVQCIDLRLIGLLLSRHVEAVSFTEPSDLPPGPGSYTPDKGFTWITIKLEDGTKHHHLGRLLAMIFETNTDLFYQILSTPSVATDSDLEEQAYQDRQRRLNAEGIPDERLASELHLTLELTAVKDLLGRGGPIVKEHLAVVEPLLYDSSIPEPLATLVREPRYRDDIESELSFIMNAALVFWHVDFSDTLRLNLLVSQVKGMLNIGLEYAMRASPEMSASQIFERTGLQPLYRLGLTEVRKLQAAARKASKPVESAASGRALLIDLLASQPPAVPTFILQLSEQQHGQLASTPAALQNLADLDKVRSVLQGD